MRPATATSSAATAESRSGPRNFAVLWKLPSLFNTTPVPTSAAQGRKSASRVVVRRYSVRVIMTAPSHRQMTGYAKMSAPDLDEERIAFCCPDREEMTNGPDRKANQPETKAEAHGAGQRPVHDRDGARCAAEQDMFGQRPMDRYGKSWHCVELFKPARHQMSAPPPKEKNDRKNELAANAMESPKTIWIRRRKPPEVSPNASARPVAIMTMTAMILATGHSMD